MSQTLGIHVEVDNYAEGRADAIVDAARTVWAFDREDGVNIFAGAIWMYHRDKGYEFSFVYAKQLRDVIWKANGAYCPVRVGVSFPEQTPYDAWNYEDEEEYKEWVRTTTD